ncbi:Poly P3, partial [Paramuricea clavata]
MCDKDCHITGTKSASKQARGSDEITSPPIKNDLADIKAAMTEMMSSFKNELLKQFAPGEQTGPAIDHDLATIVNELLTEKLTKEKLEPVQDKYLKPENCENLVAPKINKPIWQQLKQETKNTDSTFQKIQQLALSSLYAVLQVCNNLSSKQNIEDSVIMLTHSIVLSLAANRELNLKRRDLLRSDLNKQYAALCNPSTPVSQYLFGDDLNKEMEDLSKASKLTKKVTPSQRMEPVRPRAIPKLLAEQSETVPEVENQ